MMNKMSKAVVIVLAVMSVMMVLGRMYIFTPYQVSGMSMSPTLTDGDKLLLVEGKEYKRGDIIVMDSVVTEGSTYVKRVIGVSGDTVKIEDGKVYVNDEEVVGDEIGDTLTNTEEEVSTVNVPEGEVYVLGDNREGSTDSRYFGTVDLSVVNGKMLKGINF